VPNAIDRVFSPQLETDTRPCDGCTDEWLVGVVAHRDHQHGDPVGQRRHRRAVAAVPDQHADARQDAGVWFETS
jgi:hypothetical protein